MEEHPYRKTYQRLPLKKLLQVIDQPLDYDPLALALAWEELKNRRIPEHDVEELRHKKAARKHEGEKRHVSQKRLNRKISPPVIVINPFIQKSPLQRLTFIGLFLTVVALVILITEFAKASGMVFDGSWDE